MKDRPAGAAVDMSALTGRAPAEAPPAPDATEATPPETGEADDDDGRTADGEDYEDETPSTYVPPSEAGIGQVDMSMMTGEQPAAPKGREEQPVWGGKAKASAAHAAKGNTKAERGQTRG